MLILLCLSARREKNERWEFLKNKAWLTFQLSPPWFPSRGWRRPKLSDGDGGLLKIMVYNRIKYTDILSIRHNWIWNTRVRRWRALIYVSVVFHLGKSVSECPRTAAFSVNGVCPYLLFLSHRLLDTFGCLRLSSTNICSLTFSFGPFFGAPAIINRFAFPSLMRLVSSGIVATVLHFRTGSDCRRGCIVTFAIR